MWGLPGLPPHESQEGLKRLLACACLLESALAMSIDCAEGYVRVRKCPSPGWVPILEDSCWQRHLSP